MTIRNVQGSDLQVRWIPAIVTYVLMAFAVCYFTESAKDGLLLGLVVYGIFNGTCHAIFQGWDATTAVKDTMWGTLVFGLVAALV